MIEVFYLLVLGLVLNSYFLYPLIITIIAKLFYRKEDSNSNHFSVSILISAYNEEKVVKDRILNIEHQEFDKNRIEVLIGSDCSNDKTNDILIDLAKNRKWLRVFIYNNRQGKASVLNQLVQHAKNDILVFTDANTVFDKKALNNLIESFSSSKIGGVCGKLVLSDGHVGSESVEEAKYWKFETFIKKAEGDLGVLIGANGGIFAIRKFLFEQIPIKKAVTDDLYISLKVLSKGYSFIYKTDAIAFEDVGHNVATEFKRKIRFSATNFQTLVFVKDLLVSKKMFLSYALWSHKVLRWFFPVLAIILLILSLFLLHIAYVKILFYLQLTFYILGIIGWLLSRIKIKVSLFSLPYFFILSNIAIVLGFIRFLKKEHSVIWESTERN